MISVSDYKGIQFCPHMNLNLDDIHNYYLKVLLYYIYSMFTFNLWIFFTLLGLKLL